MTTYWKRWALEAQNALQDAYGTWVLGDDAGKSARIVLVIKPTSTVNMGRVTSTLNLGMTFLEINGRAYVHTVTPNSQADLAGVQPRDAVQYAAVYSRDWHNTDQSDEEDDDDDDEDDDEHDVMMNPHVDDLAAKHALAQETKGIRISYNELRRVLAEGMDATQSPIPATAAPTLPPTVKDCPF